MIVLDPGHGGNDSGACAFGIQEKDLNLSVAREAKKYLAVCGHTVLMTRDSDTSMSLKERGCFSVNKGADVFLSIHHDAADVESARGCHGFHELSAPNGAKLAKYVAEEIAIRNQVPFSYGEAASDWFGKRLGVLNGCNNWVKVTAALVECLFLTNPIESAIAKTGDYAEKTGYAIAMGIQKFLELPLIAYTGTADVGSQSHDVDEISSWASSAAQFMKSNEMSDCTRPKEAATREEVWCYLERLYNLIRTKATSGVLVK